MRKLLHLIVIMLILTAVVASSVYIGKVTAIGSAVIKKTVLSSGGGRSGCGEVQINATLGQALIGSSQESSSNLISGFWGWVQETMVEFLNFIPMIFH